MKYVQHWLTWWQKALFPHQCLVCAQEGVVLCDRHVNLPSVVLPPLLEFTPLDQLYAVTDYQNSSARALVKRLKYYRHRPAVTLMAESLQEMVPWSQYPRAVLVPLPLHPWRQWQRGFNQSGLLGRAVAEFLTQAYDEQSFKRVRYTKQQARLSQTERQQNLKNAFAWQGSTVPDTVFLLDDVCTTGSTLKEAARTLKKAGVKRVIGVVFAYQPSR